MCYSRPAAASFVAGAALAGVWATETHRAAITTILGAVLATEVLVAIVVVMVVLLRIREEHTPDQIVEHGHHHHREHPVHTPNETPAWPLQAWEGKRKHDQAA